MDLDSASQRIESKRTERWWGTCGLLAIALVAIASAARPSLYPVFVDAYYHMSAIEGFDRAGGVVTHAFWEMAPGGRPHIYPPGFHAAGHLASLLGLSARHFVAVLSWASYPLSLLGVWLWLREVAGPRGAFFAVALLVGPGAWFWNQSVHTANALVFVVAPLAFLALERGRFLACAAATFVAVATHPMGLFLPAALVANALFRGKPILPGLAAAAAPVVLYFPWLAHVWANRAFFSEAPLGRTVELSAHGFHVGVLSLGLAALGALEAALARGKALGLLGSAAGFAVAIPLGFAGRFFFYGVHWPLAALGGFGATRLLERLEGKPAIRRLGQVGGAALAVLALAVHPALNVRSVPTAPVARETSGEGPGSSPALRVYLTVRPSLIVKLLDHSTRPDPLRGLGPLGDAPLSPAGLLPHEVDLIHRAGADAFLERVRSEAGERAVVFTEDPVLAALVSGVSGRASSSGLLRDVLSAERPAKLEECAFAAVIPRGRRLLRVREPVPGFSLVFKNQFGGLWRNTRAGAREVEVPKAALPTGLVAILAALVLGLSALDLAGPAKIRQSRLASALALAIAAACLAPLGFEAVRELRSPRKPAWDSSIPQVPPVLPQELSEAYARLEQAEGPRWTSEDEERFFELIRTDRFEEALRLVQAALEGRPPPGAAR